MKNIHYLKRTVSVRIDFIVFIKCVVHVKMKRHMIVIYNLAILVEKMKFI